jgi:hypothetical protein
VKPHLEVKVKRSFDLGKCIEEYGRNLFHMALLAEGYGSKVLFCVQPYIGRKERTQAEEKLTHPEFLQHMEPAYAGLVEAARDVATKTGSVYVDTVNLFRENDEEIFYDRVHIEPKRGNALMARHLADSLAGLPIAERWR